MAGEDGEEEEGIVSCFECKSRGLVCTMEDSSDTCANCGGGGPKLCNVNGASELRRNEGAYIQNNLTDLLLPTSHSAFVPERGQIPQSHQLCCPLCRGGRGISLCANLWQS